MNTARHQRSRSFRHFKDGMMFGQDDHPVLLIPQSIAGNKIQLAPHPNQQSQELTLCAAGLQEKERWHIHKRISMRAASNVDHSRRQCGFHNVTERENHEHFLPETC